MVKIKVKKRQKAITEICKLEESYNNFLLENEIIINENKLVNGLQLVLDVVGFIPGAGEVADGINLLISLIRKDFIGVGLSAISMIPAVGDIVAKPIKFAIKGASNTGDVAKLAQKFSPKVKSIISKNAPTVLKQLDNPSLVKKVESGIQKALESKMVPGWVSKEITPLIQKGVVKQCFEVGSNLLKTISQSISQQATQQVAKKEISKQASDAITTGVRKTARRMYKNREQELENN